MSLLNKPIEEVIETLYNSIKSKRETINNIKNEYNIDNDTYKEININRLKLIDLLNEFEVTISQSLQAIQTFKVEIFNLKEKQATEEILNLTNEFQTNINQNEKKISNNKNNILDIIDSCRAENSIIEPKNENINKKNLDDINNNINIITKQENKKDYNFKEFSALKEAKLNFDYSSLLNNSQSSLKTSLSNLDKFKNNNDKTDINKSQKKENHILLKNNIDNIKSNKIDEQIPPEDNTDIELINNNLNKEDIEEEQPSKLNINIIKSNNQLTNKIKSEGNNNSQKDISCFSENVDYFNNSNNNNNNENNINTSNKFYSMRQSDLYNINNKEKNYNYKFNLLDTNKENNLKENEKIDMNNNIYNNSNYEESDIISLVSKNDIIKEKFKKLENDEKINKLIEEIFSIKAFKLYILDKFGNGKQDIFFQKIKNGEINKEKLESELNLLKEIHNSNNDSDNNIDNNFALTESKKQNKHNKVMNKTMSDININLNSNNMNIDTENNFSHTDKYNIYKKINRKKYNKINEESKNKNPNNIKFNLREKEKINISNNTNSYVNKSKNTSSHSVSSIRARIKSKKF